MVNYTADYRKLCASWVPDNGKYYHKARRTKVLHASDTFRRRRRRRGRRRIGRRRGRGRKRRGKRRRGRRRGR
jgi:hypothetical protein